jgi:hypothetical protein
MPKEVKKRKGQAVEEQIPVIESIEGDGDEETGPEDVMLSTPTQTSAPVSQKPEFRREMPDVQKDFANLLKMHGIGTPKITAEAIALNIAETGTEFVFEEPEQLAERLRTWHENISAYKRPQIIEQWFKSRGIPVQSALLKNAALMPSQIDKQKAVESEASYRFAVDLDGTIRNASEGEKGMTYAEAERASARNITNIEKKEAAAKQAISSATPPSGKFVRGEDGTPEPVEGERYSAQDFMILEAIKSRRNQGDNRGVTDILEEEVRKQQAIAQLTGKQPGASGNEMSELDRIRMWKELGVFGGTDPALKETLEIIKTKLNAPAESPEMAMLKAQNAELMRRLDDQEKAALMEKLAKQDGMIGGLYEEIKKLKEQPAAGSTSEMDVLKEGLSGLKGTIDRAGGDIMDTVKTFAGKKPPAMTDDRKKLLDGALNTALDKDTAAEQQAAKIWGK